MSKSFALVNGDLQLGTSRGYDIVSGKQKLLQDLRLWFTEQIGTDSILSTYGSGLDGGVINGEVQDSYIGRVVTQSVLGEIRIKTLELIQSYQQMQFTKMQDEALLYDGKNTLDADEVLDGIESIQLVNVGTTILIQVILTTLGGSSLKLTVPLDLG